MKANKKQQTFSSRYSLYDDLAVGVVVLSSKDWKICYANVELESLSLYSQQKIYAINFKDLFSEQSVNELENFLSLQPIHSQVLVTSNDLILKRKNGSQINVSLSMCDQADRDEKVITIINNEPRKELERELEQAYAQMIQTSKFLSLAEMAAGIAHEINNPLAIAHAYAEQLHLLAERGSVPLEKISKYSQKITKATMRASDIIVSLKKLSRSDEDDGVNPVSVEELVSEVCSMYQERCRRAEVNLIKNTPEEKYFALCSSSQILQVLLNLVENALYAVRNQKEKWIEIAVTINKNGLCFSVEDSGPGVAPTLQQEIMNPFFTTKEVGEGTGLGLSISRNIIEKHKSRLVLDKKTKGARFYFHLPIVDPESGEQQSYDMVLPKQSITAKNANFDRSLDLSSFHLLLVDDESDLLDSMASSMAEYGFQVSTASNGQEAIDVLKSETIDVVVSDVKMPVVDGVELVQKIIKINKEIPKIFFVTGSTEVTESKFYNLGVNGFFYKPVKLQTVFEAVVDSLVPEQKYLTRQKPRVYFEKIFHDDGKPNEINPANRIFNIGRGGMFVRESQQLPAVDDFVRFNLNFELNSQLETVSGIGRVRWARSKQTNTRPRGFGMEFYRFEEKGFSKVIEYLEQLRTKSYIPES